ncbi:hypothetical protein BLNAU_21955 [Blattamonas nauphoetae]|uniref:Uncharacterized protein n=1 Tax=Blattamonas nauphoetae TaxID=2049346 RepID=A0ABQ9WUX7_9EUKA|nr:hypothetical protein BLNAU_21955 [Blattamonas nauphoetae]
MLRHVHPLGPDGSVPWLRRFSEEAINLLNANMRCVLLSLSNYDDEPNHPYIIPVSFPPRMEEDTIPRDEALGLTLPRHKGRKHLPLTESQPQMMIRRRRYEPQVPHRALNFQHRLGWNPLSPPGNPIIEAELREKRALSLNVIDLLGLVPRALDVDTTVLMTSLSRAILPNEWNDPELSAARSLWVATASDGFPISLFSNLLFLDHQLNAFDIPQKPATSLLNELYVRGYRFEEQVISSMIYQRRVATIHTMRKGFFKGKKLDWAFKLDLKQVTKSKAEKMRKFDPNVLYVHSAPHSSEQVSTSQSTAIEGFFWQTHTQADLFCAIQIATSPDPGDQSLQFLKIVVDNFKTFMTRRHQKKVAFWFLWIVPHTLLETYVEFFYYPDFQLVGVVNANELVLQQITGGDAQHIELFRSIQEQIENETDLTDSDSDDNFRTPANGFHTKQTFEQLGDRMKASRVDRRAQLRSMREAPDSDDDDVERTDRGWNEGRPVEERDRARRSTGERLQCQVVSGPIQYVRDADARHAIREWNAERTKEGCDGRNRPSEMRPKSILKSKPVLPRGYERSDPTSDSECNEQDERCVYEIGKLNVPIPQGHAPTNESLGSHEDLYGIHKIQTTRSMSQHPEGDPNCPQSNFWGTTYNLKYFNEQLH